MIDISSLILVLFLIHKILLFLIIPIDSITHKRILIKKHPILL